VQKIRGDHLAAAAWAADFGGGVRFAIELVIRPDDLFTIRETGRRRMTARASLAALAWHLCWARLSAARLRARAADRVRSRTTGSRDAELFGEELVLFGSVEKDAATPATRTSYDLVVTVSGPRATW